MTADVNRELVELGDPGELVRHVDRLTAARDWDALADLSERCRRAVERGKQLWGVAAHVDYRLALEGPGPHAAAALLRSDGRFALGPLPEVAASTHTWDDLSPHLPPGPERELFAHERVVRGDDLRDRDIDAVVLELPLALASWEPPYPTATYHAYELDVGSVAVPELTPVELPGRGELRDDPDAVRALQELTRTWQRDSNGRCEVVAVTGDALSAIAALGPRRARVCEVSPATALALMAWSTASGGAHGRRRGLAAGRFDAWWAAAALAGLDGVPAPDDQGAIDDFGAALASLRWFAWDAFEPPGGWRLQLAVDDPAEGIAWAITAIDTA